MAETLEQYDFSSAAQYPWDKWLDGRVWRLTRGTDFVKIKSGTMIQNANQAAKVRGGKVRTRKESDDAVVIQYYVPGGNSQ